MKKVLIAILGVLAAGVIGWSIGQSPVSAQEISIGPAEVRLPIVVMVPSTGLAGVSLNASIPGAAATINCTVPPLQTVSSCNLFNTAVLAVTDTLQIWNAGDLASVGEFVITGDPGIYEVNIISTLADDDLGDPLTLTPLTVVIEIR